MLLFSFSHFHEKSSEAGLYQLRVVVTHVILQLVTAGELLLADGAPEGSSSHAVQRGAELAPALAGVDHVLDLQQTRRHLAIVMISVSVVWTSRDKT